jgi:Rrf2 family protein
LKFNTKTRYGLRAMVEIANGDQKTGVFQKDISVNQDISNKYLDHIILALKVANLIINQRGKNKGYILTRPASEITVYDINNAFHPGICVVDCLSRSIHCDRKDKCSARGFWGSLNNQIVAYFKSVTLEDLINQKLVLDD